MKMMLMATLILTTLALHAETTVYDASRLVTADIDTTSVVGQAIVEDGGPFTPIDRLSFDLVTVPCDDGKSVQFSPRPAACQPIVFDGEAQWWTPKGMQYVFDDGTNFSVLRRGTVATGSSDPSLILMDTKGRVMVFRQKRNDGL
jgi:hypothetical protein